MKEVNQRCIDINCRELFSAIVEHSLSEEANETPRPSTSKWHVVYEGSPGLKMDQYSPRRKVWTAVKEFDLGITGSTMIYRDGKVIIIGGRATGNLALNTVNIKDHFPHL